MGQKSRPETETMDDGQLAKHIAETTDTETDWALREALREALHEKLEGLSDDELRALRDTLAPCGPAGEGQDLAELPPAPAATEPPTSTVRATPVVPVVVAAAAAPGDPDCAHVWQPHTRTGGVKLDFCRQCGAVRTA